MKKSVFFLFLFIWFTAFSRVWADGPCGENAVWTLSDDGIITVSGTGPMEDYSSAFDVPWKPERKQIKGVIIEEGITKVGKHAFSDCYDVSSVSLPSTLTAIGDWGFSHCNELTEISLPDGIVSIGEYAFQNCLKLRTINIPSRLEAINNRTFEYCYKLNSVTLPETIRHIGDGAFSDCYELTEIVIPASVAFISEKSAFAGCRNLAQITVDPGNENYNSVSGILFSKDQSRLLYYPAGKTGSSYTVPETVTYVNAYAFYYNPNLMSLTIPGSVETVGKSAFSNLKKLTDITLSEGLKSIGDYAFSTCSSLREITLPASLGYLGEYAFSSCSNLESIRVAEGSEYLASVDGVLFSADMSLLIHYPRAKKGIAYAVPEGVERIGENAFYKSPELVSVTFPDGLTSIGKNAFNSCEKLTGIAFPDSLLTIEEQAFYGCQGLTEIVLPEKVVSIGRKAFNFCMNIVSITFLNPQTALDKLERFEDRNDLLTFIAPEGSAAEAFAKEHDILFKVLEEPEEKEGSDSWICAECGAEMTGGKFCSECGAPRPHTQVCGNCGYTAPEGKEFKFCPECGSPMTEQPSGSGAGLPQTDNEALNQLMELVEKELKRK